LPSCKSMKRRHMMFGVAELMYDVTIETDKYY
jgi:hypothetical protein